MSNLSRRFFLKSAVAGSAALTLGNIDKTFAAGEQFTSSYPLATPTQTPKFRTKLYKSQIIKEPTDEICAQLIATGYEGVEVQNWDISVAQARAFRQIAEKHNLRIHSVMRGWASFNSADEATRRKTIDETATAIRSASALGADTVLLVPCRIDTKPMPEAWDFQISFDDKTLMVKKVTKDNNSQYAAYIKDQNIATEKSIAAIEELIPLAAKEGVRIAIENVWNNLWCTPEFFAAFVHYFDNPWIGAYFDLGNHTKYGRAEAYIKALKHSIVRLHIKGYKVNEVLNTIGGGPGDWVAIDEASIDWKSVRRAIDEAGYNGYVSVEEGNYDYAKYSDILGKFIEGTL
ncbi:MAG: sugar phosphate isomerase/epimerase [Tannerella sp.]|jgi:hexulose-6-phosphate isomerase|nr:sugar phosphate isomerase/epimerase [Tannerella sp.]